ncbi:unnamed protein product [Didymodactylos carnosus]|uniref:DDE Tnp4 domain-containing protein n=1 Tax=Didymodactylos carnosus TaxID=1234261 RepID=A0A8S2WH20_9BILA|nr:unnamed protein product [Didymodactylos carnosus]
MRKAVLIEKRVVVALYTLSSTAEFRTIANLFGIDKSTVLELLYDFVNVINDVILPQAIQYPTSLTGTTEMINGFWQNWNYPQCIGVVDGCHIPIYPPSEYASDYYNYKGWSSIILLVSNLFITLSFASLEVFYLERLLTMFSSV